MQITTNVSDKMVETIAAYMPHAVLCLVVMFALAMKVFLGTDWFAMVLSRFSFLLQKL